MISLTYGVSGVLLAISGYLFQQGLLDVTQQAIAWMVIFFFASAAASSAYLTVAETFPLEIRALAIAVFYAFGTGLGGIIGPTLFGELIETGDRSNVLIGYLIGAGLMLFAALVQSIWGRRWRGRYRRRIATNDQLLNTPRRLWTEACKPKMRSLTS